MGPEATMTCGCINGLFWTVTAVRRSVCSHQFEAAACADDLAGHDCSRESENRRQTTIANSVARRQISTNFTWQTPC